MSRYHQMKLATLGAGFNLGGVFEMSNQSRELKRIKAVLNAFKKKRFQHVRIPASWFGLSDTDVSKVEQTVRYAIGIGLKVVLNFHHDNQLDTAFQSRTDQVSRFQSKWRQICQTFRDVSADRLVYEVKNEPAGTMGDFSGGSDPFSQRSIELVRALNKAGYDTIRQNDRADRFILISPNAKASSYTLKNVYPDRSSLPGNGADANVGIEIHSYDSWSNCGQDGRDSTIAEITSDVDKLVKRTSDWIAKTGVQNVYLGEYGVGRRDPSRRNTDAVRAYYRMISTAWKNRGWPYCFWDDGDGSWYEMHRVESSGKVSFPYGLVDSVALSRTKEIEDGEGEI